MKFKHLFILALSFLLLTCSSDDDSPAPTTPTAKINFSFVNDGFNPSLSVTSTSGNTQIDQNSTLEAVGSRFEFTFTGVTFSKNNKVFAVRNNGATPQVKTESGEWIEDVENEFFRNNSKSLDIVLVLDVSLSLGNNIDNVKDSAVSMIEQILSENDEAKIAVVKFSEGNVSSSFSSNLNILESFIQTETLYTSPINNETYALESRAATGLYESVLTAISMLSSSSAKGQGIITFTDGTNNYQENPNNNVSTVVVNALNNTDIKHYTIGFVGNDNAIDRGTLENIAVNGEFASANSISNLNQVFTRFSNSVATIYDFVYETNNAPFTGVKEFRLLVKLKRVN